ncbi:MAG: beta-galactosidase [Segetibacter sp.]|nr:beta-galactosidase [Segetibacter sp.]
MKKYIIIFLFIVAFQATHAQTDTGKVYIFSYFKDNGNDGLHLAFSNDGYNWKSLFGDSSVLTPAVSNDKLMRDPCIIRGGDGKFHMVWTVSWNDKGIGYASSEDLINWSDQKFLPVMMFEPKVRNTWAPEITYDSTKKRYMIYWASTIEGRYPQADTAAESKYNHRIYYTITKDFVKFKKTKLLFDPSFSVIDASIQPDKKGYVMFLKNETRYPVEKNIRVAFSKKLTGPYKNLSNAITGSYWAEGPTSIKIGEEWIVYFDKYTLGKYGAVSSTDLVNWQDISDKITFPKGARHGTVFTISPQEFQTLLAGNRR